ncbi:sugar ABC transporter permease [Treponema zuelzerae]|uniref:Maltose/maltodextrin transport system permease protein n=1 Tax=Teretinema zuelzerae TaxID=156 RepID=A0AAE3EIL1_9SPIR|nr:sugar ABC transporter permease [Teretinema zuelzerae]MCD1655147.1 sugar ABC transporter permease [Teretinema zuelzerae]
MASIMPADGSAQKKITITASLFMGLAHIVHLKDYAKGVFFALTEVLFLAFSPFIVHKLVELVTLGSPQPDLPIKQRGNSIFMLIDGILLLAVIAIFIVTYVLSVRSAQSSYAEYCRKKSFRSFKESANGVFGSAFPVLGLAPSFLMILIFVLVPLLFSASVAFTNYSAPSNIPPNNTVDWVGFENFTTLLGGETSWSAGFARVASWTLIWAFAATITCYFGGLLVAVLLKESKIRFAPAFRIIFILPYAVPAVVSMLVWKNLLNGTFGTVNRTLMALGLIDEVIPWLGHPALAQFTVVMVNLWAGFGYFMLLTMGTMTAVSQDLFEAARIDGANKFQVLRRITLPLVLYQTMPLIIMSFTHNINNFGAIFFLTGGNPTVADSTTTSAGGTDILVTWIYKLTITLLKYNYASVIAVMIFIVLAPFAIFNFSRTKAYKEGEV